MRQFETGATRDAEEHKYDYEGFLSPEVLVRFGEYMHKHREQADGTIRDSDNWQKGMPFPVYLKSAFRHFLDWWRWHRLWHGVSTYKTEIVPLEDSLCALLFNAQGYLHELLKARRVNG